MNDDPRFDDDDDMYVYLQNKNLIIYVSFPSYKYAYE
jgi:hypothetical protein